MLSILVTEPKKRKTTVPIIRHHWTEIEEKELRRLLPLAFISMKCPGQKYVEAAQQKSRAEGGAIFRIARDTIKKKVSNMLKKDRLGQPN